MISKLFYESEQLTPTYETERNILTFEIRAYIQTTSADPLYSICDKL